VWRFFDEPAVDPLPAVGYFLPAVVGDFPAPNPACLFEPISLYLDLPSLFLVGQLVVLLLLPWAALRISGALLGWR
jgi:hypothetical protein